MDLNSCQLSLHLSSRCFFIIDKLHSTLFLYIFHTVALDCMTIASWPFMVCIVSHTEPTPTMPTSSTRQPVTSINLLRWNSTFRAWLRLRFHVYLCLFICFCLIICHFKPILQKYAVDWKMRLSSASKAVDMTTSAIYFNSLSSWILSCKPTVRECTPFCCGRYINIGLCSGLLELFILLRF